MVGGGGVGVGGTKTPGMIEFSIFKTTEEKRGGKKGGAGEKKKGTGPGYREGGPPPPPAPGHEERPGGGKGEQGRHLRTKGGGDEWASRPVKVFPLVLPVQIKRGV